MKIRKLITQLVLIIFIITMVGCSTSTPPNPQDPYESYNRAMFAFNRVADKYAIRPIAKTYDFILPDPVKTGIGNVFSNLGQIPDIGNDLLQLKIGWAIADIWRFAINSTVGLGGLIDVATPFGLKKRHQDLGMTFAKWGAHDSPYFVIPILGPATVRDSVGLFANYELMTVYPHIKPYPVRWGLVSLYFIHTRHEFLKADHLIDEAIDPYVFVRDAFLQRREYLIDKNEGKATKDEEDTFPDADEDIDDFIDATS